MTSVAMALLLALAAESADARAQSPAGMGAATRATLDAGGFAIASTDMGHQGMGGEFGRDPQKREDFAHRGVHVTAVASKKLIRAFYGRPNDAWSYRRGNLLFSGKMAGWAGAAFYRPHSSRPR